MLIKYTKLTTKLAYILLKSSKGTKEKIYVYPKDQPIMRRYFFSFIYFLYLAGFDVVIVASPRFILRTIEADDENYWLFRFFKIRLFRFSSRGKRVISEHPPFEDNVGVHIPLSAHPKFLFTNRLRFNSNRNIKRPKIVFAGNVTGGAHERHADFICRNQLVNFLTSNFQDETLVISEWSQKDKIWNTDKPIVIVDAYRAELNEREYFDFYQSGSSFLAMPGIISPICHNLAEALSCGLFPIFQRSSLSEKYFKNEVNSIIWGNLNELKQSIHLLLNMDEYQILCLRNNALAVYNEHFNPDKIASKLTHIEKVRKITYETDIGNFCYKVHL